MDEQNMVCAYNGILSKKMNQLLIMCNMDDSQKHTEWKKSHIKEYLPYNLIYGSSKTVKTNLMVQYNQNSDCLWEWVGSGIDWQAAQVTFQDDSHVLYVGSSC